MLYLHANASKVDSKEEMYTCQSGDIASLDLW